MCIRSRICIRAVDMFFRMFRYWLLGRVRARKVWSGANGFLCKNVISRFVTFTTELHVKMEESTRFKKKIYIVQKSYPRTCLISGPTLYRILYKLQLMNQFSCFPIYVRTIYLIFASSDKLRMLGKGTLNLPKPWSLYYSIFLFYVLCH